MITDPELAKQIRSQYTGRLAILYDRMLHHPKIISDKSITTWNIIEGETEAFYNPKITKVELTIEDVPNQLYSQGMGAYQQWDEIKKLPSIRRSSEVNAVAKDLALADVSLAEFLTTKYAQHANHRRGPTTR